MKRRNRPALRMLLAAALSIATAAGAANPYAGNVTYERIRDAEKMPGDWTTYHGSYRGWHYSALEQIDTKNVDKLRVAWTHAMPRSIRGLQSMPLAADGILYYSGSYNQVFALDGSTGEVLWYHRQKLDDGVVSGLAHSPYNRGIALGQGNVYMGTLDGKLVALDMKSGQLKWETKLIDTERVGTGFTGAPLFVKDKVIIGSHADGLSYRGPIFGVDASSGKEVWKFYTAGGNDETKSDARNTWGGDSWKTGGGGGWMPGGYDPETNLVWWGTGSPTPLYDAAGKDWMTGGPRPGTNLYTSSVIALDPDTGELKAYHQQLPHDSWGFNSAGGEFLMLERAGKKYVVHPSRSGFVFVYDRAGKLQNVWRLIKHINFVEDIKPDGTLVGRREPTEGAQKGVCPASSGGTGWSAGSFNPRTGLYYKVGNEWCMDIDAGKSAPGPGTGKSFSVVPPSGEKAHGHVSARDPLTGAKKWEIGFAEPPVASLLSTAGNLLFVPDARGILRAFDAGNGRELWRHNNGQGHAGGIISYAGKDGKQYVAVATGWDRTAAEHYETLFGSPFDSLPNDSGVLMVFSLP